MSTKVRLVKAMVFPEVMYGCESWIIKKAEHQRIDAFQLWFWRRLLRVPCTARRSNHPEGNQSWIFTGSWSWNSNTLATWCKELTHWKRPWCWERLTAREGDNRGWDGWMASPTQWTWVWASSGSWVMDREAWRAAVHDSQRIRQEWATELISTGVFQTKLTLSSSLLFSHFCDWNHHLLGCSRWNLGCYLRALSLSHYLTTSHQFYLVKFFI